MITRVINHKEFEEENIWKKNNDNAIREPKLVNFLYVFLILVIMEHGFIILASNCFFPEFNNP